MDCDILFDLVAPQDIERLSMERIDAEVGEPKPFAGDEWAVARRIIHACGDIGVVEGLVFHPQAVAEGVLALRQGATIVTDTHMARVGIPKRRLAPLGAQAMCLLGEEEVARRASTLGITQTAAAMDVALDRGLAQIVVIGNAPTALIHLVDRLEHGAPAPRLVVGMPVGFVNAAQSKEFFLQRCSELPFIVLRGRRGGSALAASVVNALAELALGH